MGEDLIVKVDHVIIPDALQSAPKPEGAGTSVESSSSRLDNPAAAAIDIKEEDSVGEDEPLIQTVECRICQEEDSIKNLEVPCACSGSLKVLSAEVWK